MKDCLRLIHFHIGSQITKIRRIQTALREASQFYVQLHKMGYNVDFVDCGGGLGVDYDGTRSPSSESSVNYSIQEYVNDCIYTFVDAANKNDLPHPNLITESGRSLAAHHSVLVIDVLETASLPEMPEEFEPDENSHQLVKDLYDIWDNLSPRNVLEDWHDAEQIREEVLDLFVDMSDVVWLLTKRGLYNVSTKQTYPVRTDLNLQDMEYYDEHLLMMFYDNGLLEITDLETGSKSYSGHPYDAVEAKNYSGSSVQKTIGNTVYQLRNGQNAGILMRFDIGEQTWKTILKTPYYLSNIVENDSVIYVPSAYGYWTYDMKTEQLEHINELQMASGGKLQTDINAMVFDQQGGLWIGTEKRGLLYSRPKAAPFKVYGWDNIRALELANILESLPEPQTSYRNRPVNCVFRDSRGWDWVGTSSGLQLYRSKTDRLPVVYTRKDGLLNNVIHTIIEDDLHNIWVGTSYGLSCLVFENNKIRRRTSEWTSCGR